MILFFCRVWARILYHLRLLKRGAWGPDWFALYYYSKIPGCWYHSYQLKEEWFPEVNLND